jgi:hypothetical protein
MNKLLSFHMHIRIYYNIYKQEHTYKPATKYVYTRQCVLTCPEIIVHIYTYYTIYVIYIHTCYTIGAPPALKARTRVRADSIGAESMGTGAEGHVGVIRRPARAVSALVYVWRTYILTTVTRQKYSSLAPFHYILYTNRLFGKISIS